MTTEFTEPIDDFTNLPPHMEAMVIQAAFEIWYAKMLEDYAQLIERDGKFVIVVPNLGQYD